MKTLIKTVALATLLACQTAFAQPDDGERLEHLKQKLQLTAEQTEQVKKILADTEPQRKALREQMKALRQQVRERVKAVLNKEQQEKLAKMEEERKARHSRRRGMDRLQEAPAKP